MELEIGEHIEYLGGGIELIVSKEHTFGTDALLLASFSMTGRKKLACDLGSGCGIIPFYWEREKASQKIFAVDIQKNAVGQIERSVSLNNLDNIFPVLCDIRNLDEMKKYVPFGRFDLVSMNPPYTKSGSGIVSKSGADKIARHETMCSLDDVCLCASKLLKFGGTLSMCLRPERLVEIIDSMQKYKIEPKKIRFVSQRTGKPPWLCLISGRLGGNSAMTVENELYIENPDGGQSDEMIKILGSYKK